MPEWLSRSDRPSGPWTVVPGAPCRGEAFTDLVQHRMRVPFGDDATSRCVRAHELMHAKVSPLSIWIPDDLEHLEESSVVAAEEFRVNMLVKAAGFPVDRYLADGSERRTAERLGANGDWNAAISMLAAVAGTGSARPFLNGLRATRPEWMPPVREFTRLLQQLWRRSSRYGVAPIASTAPWRAATRGWQFTLQVATLIQGTLLDESTSTIPEPSMVRRRSVGRGFAPLVELRLDHPRRVGGGLRHRPCPQVTGRHVRYLDRLLTDPQRRIFAGRRRTPGGTVLIDQSGSMQLTEADLWRIITAAPGCTVIGYSHPARSRHRPNIWVLAHQGHVVAEIPHGNGGNGVDGPALAFASARHRPRDPFIWVCDGFVTDDHDNFSSELAEQCAHLVIAECIHQVADVDHAVIALGRAARGDRLPTQAVGPIRGSRAWADHVGASRPHH